MSGLSQGWFDFAGHFNNRAAKIHEWAKEKGFWDLDEGFEEPRDKLPEKLCLIHSEISECLEADRQGDLFDDKLVNRKGVEVELADAVIRIMDLAQALDLDLGTTIAEKMVYNQNRPYKHGKEY